jgi:hypothetical protein
MILSRIDFILPIQLRGRKIDFNLLPSYQPTQHRLLTVRYPVSTRKIPIGRLYRPRIFPISPLFIKDLSPSLFKREVYI